MAVFELLTVFVFLIENYGARYGEICIIIRVNFVEETNLEVEGFLVVCIGVKFLVRTKSMSNFEALGDFPNDAYNCSTATLIKLVEFFSPIFIVEV